MTTSTSTLTLKSCIGGHGQHGPLKDGSIKARGVEFDFVEVAALPQAFRRMVRGLEFDMCEMAVMTYLGAKAYGKPITGIPVFPLARFSHGGIVFNPKSGVQTAKDLEGKRVAARSYTLTPAAWGRDILATEGGVDLTKVTWVCADDEHVEECRRDAPANVEYLIGADLAKMLIDGEVAAGIALGPVESPDVKRLFPDARAADKAAYEKTGILPLNHMVVIKDSLIADHPWLPEALYTAFSEAKDAFLATAPDADIGGAGIMTGDPLPFGLNANRKALEKAIDMAYEQGITPRRLVLAEIFPYAFD